MMLAYRRGLLKPDYPNGLQSRLRERMVLQMLNDELEADIMHDVAMLNASALSGVVDPKKIHRFLEDLTGRLAHAAWKREYSDRVYHSVDEINAQFDKQAAVFLEAYKKELKEAASGQSDV